MAENPTRTEAERKKALADRLIWKPGDVQVVPPEEEKKGPDTFTVTGSIDGVATTITWTDGVFDDPSGQVGYAIYSKAQVPVAYTGPWLPAAAKPAGVAVITAMSVFDNGVSMLDDAARAILDALQDDYPIPDGALA